MEHVVESRIMEAVWDGEGLDAAEHDHLALCPLCQEQFATMALLRDELAVSRQSQIRPEAEAALLAIFESVRGQSAPTTPLRSLLTTLSSRIDALLMWDSRQQAGMAGVRNGHRASYRLLFGAQTTEVELLVEPHNGFLRVTGEVMVDEREGANGLALIELMASADAKSAIEAESDANGRFTLERVPPGRYMMTVTPRYSQMLVIEPLELT